MTSQPLTAPVAAPHESLAPGQRLLSLDVFRGFIMVTLAADGFGFFKTAAKLGHWPETSGDTFAGRLWHALAFHARHPEWNSQFYVLGCAYWDLIMPAFMLMVGVAMPFSYARRRARGDAPWRLIAHAVCRAVVLVLLGMFLQTRNGDRMDRLFTNVLSQIGLGYVFVFLLLGRGFRVQLTAALVVLTGYWGLMVAAPVPDPLPKGAAASVEGLPISSDLVLHFAKHADVGTQCDRWLLGTVNPGGMATINFIPAAVTMLLGVMAGEWLRGTRSSSHKLRGLLVGGAVCMAAALAAGYTVCPIVKRIWSPSFTLFTGAWVLWMLAACYWLVDIRGSRWWTFPLVVVGTNPLAIYLMSVLLTDWTAERFRVYLGEQVFSGPYGPTIEATSVLAVFWLCCWYLYRHRIFVRI
jgi:predicted acyltransferase